MASTPVAVQLDTDDVIAALRPIVEQRLTELVASVRLRDIAPGVVEQVVAELRRWFGATQSGLAVATVVERAMWTAFGCTCRWHSDVGAVYVEDADCPMHGGTDSPLEPEPVIFAGYMSLPAETQAEAEHSVSAGTPTADVGRDDTGREHSCTCGLTGPASAPRIAEIDSQCPLHGRLVEAEHSVAEHAWCPGEPCEVCAGPCNVPLRAGAYPVAAQWPLPVERESAGGVVNVPGTPDEQQRSKEQR